MDYEALTNLFGAETVEKLRYLLENKESLSWPEKQIVTLCEGYPSDTNTEQFVDADRLNNEGWTCHTFCQYQNALEYYRQALDLCPDFPMVWNNKGLAHYRLNQFDEAKKAYERAIEINPLFIKPFSNMGILYYELSGDKKEAKNWFLKALALDPNYQRSRAYLDRIIEEEGHSDIVD